MDEKLSFIPKAEGRAGRKSAYRAHGGNLLFRASLFLIVFSLAALAYSYVYKQKIAGEIEDLSSSLVSAKAAFDVEVISEIEEAAENIGIARELLAKHKKSSNLFKALETLTHQDISFSNFSYFQEDPTVELKGEAKDYMTLAEQFKIFEKSDKIQSTTFSKFELTETGNVSFVLDITFKSGILYE